jgi:hypothetical protein
LLRTEHREGFEISWQEPPVIAYKWRTTIVSDDPRLFSLVNSRTVLLSAPTRERALTDARFFVEFVLAATEKTFAKARKSTRLAERGGD